MKCIRSLVLSIMLVTFVIRMCNNVQACTCRVPIEWTYVKYTYQKFRTHWKHVIHGFSCSCIWASCWRPLSWLPAFSPITKRLKAPQLWSHSKTWFPRYTWSKWTPPNPHPHTNTKDSHLLTQNTDNRPGSFRCNLVKDRFGECTKVAH